MGDKMVVLGIDLGTQGVRVLAVDPRGGIISTAHDRLPPAISGLPPGWFEQDPQAWWQSLVKCLRQIVQGLPAQVQVSGLAVDSTSGTIVAVDEHANPLCPAIMYSDNRSRPQVPAVRQAGQGLEDKLGYAFGSSFALPKLLWLQQVRPRVFNQARWYLHAADYLVARLSGQIGVTDFSNALKTGFDLVDARWPEFIETRLGIPLQKLPQAFPSGSLLGRLTRLAAQETGLPAGVPVYAGATDGTAAQLASGAVEPGAWDSSLGTTLVWKGISAWLVLDPQRRIYSHRHPQGWWMPGAASNTGCEWIEQEHPGQDPAILDQLAAARVPTPHLRYPLVRPGERFPFQQAEAAGFTLGSPGDPVEAFAAGLEGVALLERLGYETLADIGLAIGNPLYTTGGGARSNLWMQVRATVLNRTLLRPKTSETAMGAALLAASGCWYSSLSAAAAHMVQIAHTADPNLAWLEIYQHKYAKFTAELRRRGYLDAPG